MNKIFTIVIAAVSFSLLAMEKAQEEPKKVQHVTEKCHAAIESINIDGTRLYYYLKVTFDAMGKRNIEKDRPSHILKFLAENKGNINEATNLSYMPATAYLQCILSKHYDDLDAAFEKQYNTTKNVQKTWQWFAEDYFKQKGMEEPLAEYKRKLVAQDEETQELAKKGIFFHGDTKVIIPRVRQEGDKCFVQ